MDKKVYYGEYTLKYWVELLLKKNLELPPYQRSFVWTQDQVKGFIDGIKINGFIPPVTIGVCNINGVSHNLILDGQQRLSSILLAYFGVYPKKDAFVNEANHTGLANGTAEEDEDEPDLEYINWSLNMFASSGPQELNVRNAITNQQYSQIDFDISDDFFESHYIPFSYIIPNISDEAEQHEFYSSVFRNINILGTPLNPIESRQSLYFLKSELKDFFDPECCRNLKIELVGKNRLMTLSEPCLFYPNIKKTGGSTDLPKVTSPKWKNTMRNIFIRW